MNWKETRTLLDKIASDIIQRFTDRIDEEGPDAIGGQLAHLDLEETAAFKGFADWIKRKYEVDIAEEDYEDFCTHVAKMLIRLRQMKLDLMSELEFRGHHT